MKLIIGLGNPGEKYQNNRHNFGFKIVDFYCKERNIKFDKKKFNGTYTKVKSENGEFIIAKSHTYMNNSGEFVLMLSGYFNIIPKDILIIYDDKDIKFKKFKISQGGSSAGHNGIKNIKKVLNNDKFVRLRCGIGPISNKSSIMNFVMDNFTKKELEEIELNHEIYLKIIDTFINEDFKYISNKFNTKME